MPLTSLGREMLDEAAALSDAAWRLHVEALIISSTRLLDLEVPKRTLERQSETHGDLPPAIAELIAAGWWEDRGDTWYIGVRFGQWQRSTTQVERKRRTDRAGQERKRLHEKGDHTKCLPRSPCKRASSTDNADESSHDNAHESSRSAEQSREEKKSLEGDHNTTEWGDIRPDLRTQPERLRTASRR
jgi:hypothetical protein